MRVIEATELELMIRRTFPEKAVFPVHADLALTSTRLPAICFENGGPMLSAQKSEPRGVLRVALPRSLGLQYIVPALPRFAVQYPMLTVLTILGDCHVDLVEAEADAALRSGLVDSSLAARRVFEASFVTCASPDYLARNGTPQTPAELDRHDCLGLFSVAHGAVMEWTFEKDGDRMTFVPHGRLAMSDGEALVDTAISGAGIVTVLDVIARRSIASGALRPILTDWQREERYPIAVVYPQHQQVPAKVRVFADFVARLFPGPRPENASGNGTTPARKRAET